MSRDQITHPPPPEARELGPASSRRAAAVTPELQQQALARLKRIEGQVRGLQRMVAEERYCPDILTQVAAAHEALRSVGKLLMRNHLEHCVTGALRSGDPARAEATWQEILDLMYKHAR
jgi:CsoR family transcriptional regulator, copper-sensing transcriptional repressor